MKKLAWIAMFSVFGAACSDDDGGAAPDGGVTKTCVDFGGQACVDESVTFLQGKGAEGVIKAWRNDVEQTLDLSCGAPVIMTSTMPITVSGVVEDFQTGDPVQNTEVAAFLADDLALTTPFAMTVGDVNGVYSINLPAGAKSRMTWRMRAAGQLDTYGMNIELDVMQAMVTGATRGSVSEDTANALPAFIGVIRTPGLGVLAGSAQDCAGNELSNVIGTISSTSSAGGQAPTYVEGPQVYYFSNGDPNLPVRRTAQKVSNKDGLFVIIEIPPTSAGKTVYLQVWGFRTAADVAMGAAGLTLLSELEAPVFGDSVIAADMSPNQGPF